MDDGRHSVGHGIWSAVAVCALLVVLTGCVELQVRTIWSENGSGELWIGIGMNRMARAFVGEMGGEDPAAMLMEMGTSQDEELDGRLRELGITELKAERQSKGDMEWTYLRMESDDLGALLERLWQDQGDGSLGLIGQLGDDQGNGSFSIKPGLRMERSPLTK